MIECFVPSAGAQLFCRVRGAGKPLLLIHGAVCDSDFFEDAASVLASEFCSCSRQYPWQWWGAVRAG